MSFITKMAKNKWVVPANPTSVSFTNQTVLLTGSNTGLGLQAAIKVAAQGAKRIILAVRNAEKGAAAAAQVKAAAASSATGTADVTVEVWSLDMLSPASIKAFVARAAGEVPEGFHAAILNAGVFKNAFATAATGWEETLQVNTISTTLLALLLLPVCARACSSDFTPTLELVSSGTHYMHKLDDAVADAKVDNVLKWYNDPEHYRGSSAQYGGSKLLLMYCLPGIVKAAGSSVHVTTVCPGACQSDLARDLTSLPIRAAKVLANVVFLRTSEEGSRTFISGIGLGEKGVGKFWQNDIIREPAPLLKGEIGERLQKQVWQEVQAVLAEELPGYKEIAKL